MGYRPVLFAILFMLSALIGFQQLSGVSANPSTTDDVVAVEESPADRFTRLVAEAARGLPTDNNSVALIRSQMRRANLTAEQTGTSEEGLRLLETEAWLRGAAQHIHRMRSGQFFTDNTVSLVESHFRLADHAPEYIGSSREEIAEFRQQALETEVRAGLTRLRRN